MNTSLEKFINISSHGIHTCRYNSLIYIDRRTFPTKDLDIAMYVKGNEIIMVDMRSLKEISSNKVTEDGIMVLK